MRLRPPNQAPSRTFRLPGLVLLAALSGACSADSITSDADRLTDTFAGTLVAKASDGHLITVAKDGNLDVTLTSLIPTTTITVGLGVGQPVAEGCSLLIYNEGAKAGTILSGSVGPGTYCVIVYDVGNVTGPLTYTVSVVHP
jgi:hypothetical protein